MSTLDDVIEALHLASECCEPRDRAFLTSAHESLAALRAEAIAYDQHLDAQALAPTGEDYNHLYSLLLLS